MNTRLGNNTLLNVDIPLLWGTRAVLQDDQGRLWIIDLSGSAPKPEIIGDKPAEGIEYVPTLDGGITILSARKELYSYNPHVRRISSIALNLPDCEIDEDSIRVAGMTISGNVQGGSPVGFKIDEHSVEMGGPLPHGLAKVDLRLLAEPRTNTTCHLAKEPSEPHLGMLDHGSSFISPVPGQSPIVSKEEKNPRP